MGDYEYYPDYTWCPIKQESIKTGKFNRYRGKKCELIPIEIDRLEYMMKYIIKNEFIKRANVVQKGNFIPTECMPVTQSEVAVIVNGQRYNIT